jgi:AcrR family transcriptional regulator
MKNTKQSILNTAKELFNRLGYSQVTIRMIALELGMSSGNLNYHFRRREDILEALYFEMVAVFDDRIKGLDRQVVSLEHMKIAIQNSVERMQEYQFFWTDLYNLLQINETMKTHFQAVLKERIEGYQFVFKLLIKQEQMYAPSFPQEYLFLGQRMIDYSNTWLYASALYAQEKKGAELTEQFSFNLLSMLYPYLTEKGKRRFVSIYGAFLSL